MTDAQLKLGRAEKHLDDLEAACKRFLDFKPYCFTPEPDSDPSYQIIKAHIKYEIPTDFGLMIGDFAHNARSCLDVLTYNLSQLPALNQARRHLQFPICGTAAAYHEAIRKGRLRDVSPKHAAIIEGLQPYQGLVADDLLALLNEINNADKHRLIQVVGACVTGAEFDGVVPGFTFVVNGGGSAIGHDGKPRADFEAVNGGEITHDGAIVARIITAEQVQMNPDLPVQIKFAKTCRGVGGRPVVDTLTAIHDRVKEILGKF